MLYITTLSILYQYKEKMLDKLKSALKVFRDNSENVALIWRYERIPSEIGVILGSEIQSQFNDLIDGFRREQWGILIEGECDELVPIVDAIYGDSDAMICKALDRRIPVMIENPEII